MRLGSLLAMIFCTLVAIAHFFRVLLGVDIMIGRTTIPIWPSIFAFIFLAAVAYLIWREAKTTV